jgi:hypothetical protein
MQVDRFRPSQQQKPACHDEHNEDEMQPNDKVGEDSVHHLLRKA